MEDLSFSFKNLKGILQLCPVHLARGVSVVPHFSLFSNSPCHFVFDPLVTYKCMLSFPSVCEFPKCLVMIHFR